jgi:hypothetical protein
MNNGNENRRDRRYLPPCLDVLFTPRYKNPRSGYILDESKGGISVAAEAHDELPEKGTNGKVSIGKRGSHLTEIGSGEIVRIWHKSYQHGFALRFDPEIKDVDIETLK